MTARSKFVAVLIAVAVVTAMAPGATAGAATSAGTAQTCDFPVTYTDASGTDVTIEEKPDTIVTLAPSAAQTVKEVGAWDRVVGVSQHASYLDGADQKTNISGEGMTFVNVEVVVGLQPDLVLAPDVLPADTVEQLRDAGLTVYWFEEPKTVDDIISQTQLTGELVGACDGAAETVESMTAELDVVERAVEDEDQPRVLYAFFGFTAGEGTIIDQMIEEAGGTNVAAEAGIEGFQAISDEVVADQDPEWLILNSDQPTPPASEAYQGTTAVEQGQVLVIDTHKLNQPAPRSVDAVAQMAETFHPEAYEQAEQWTPTETPTTTPAQTDTPVVNETPTSTPEDEGAPGFGVVVALVAVLAGALLATRRN